MVTGWPYLGMFTLSSNQGMARMVPAVMFGFVDGCRCWYGKRRAPGIWSFSIIVESRLKQKMQTWSYSLRRHPSVYLEQAPARAPLACSAPPTGTRR